MKLFDSLLGKKKAPAYRPEKTSVAPVRHPSATPNTSDHSPVPRDADLDMCETVSFQWSPSMDPTRIVSFSLSAGDRPVFSANCNFSSLTIRNCLHGSRDGWRQPDYPRDYFDPKQIPLKNTDQHAIRELLEACDFTMWETPEHYIENHDAPGFHVDRSFQCTFADGKQFLCLDPNNTEFEDLLSLVRKITENNARPEDRDFVSRMLADTEKQTKQIYWLISQSLEEKWMELTSQGAPFFNYMVARELSRGDHANAKLMVNVIRFADGAAWVTDAPVPESEYQWESLSAGTKNDLGSAYDLLTQHFKALPEPGRKLFPIVVIVLDGPVTDDWLAAQTRFKNLPGVQKNVLVMAMVMGNRLKKPS